MISSEIAALADALVKVFGIDPDAAVFRANKVAAALNAAGVSLVSE